MRIYCRVLAALIMLFVGPGWAQAAQATHGVEPFFFVQLADPHVGTEMDNASFMFAISVINHLRPAFVVVCGDLIDSAGNMQWSHEYFEILSGLNPEIPVYDVAGNHDLSEDGVHPTENFLKLYRLRFGPDYYSFKYKSLYGIILDSTVISRPEDLPAEYQAQNSWLTAELAKAKSSGAEHIVVFQHHPYFLSSIDEQDQYYNLPKEQREDYIKRLRNAGVRYIFAGHTHRYGVANYGGLKMITDGSVSGAIPPGLSGLNIVVVRPNGIENRFYSFGDLPDKVNLNNPLDPQLTNDR